MSTATTDAADRDWIGLLTIQRQGSFAVGGRVTRNGGHSIRVTRATQAVRRFTATLGR